MLKSNGYILYMIDDNSRIEVPLELIEDYLLHQLQLFVSRGEFPEVPNLHRILREILSYSILLDIEIPLLTDDELKLLLKNYIDTNIEDFIYLTRKYIRQKYKEKLVYQYKNEIYLTSDSKMFELASLLLSNKQLAFNKLEDLQSKLVRIFLTGLIIDGKFTNLQVILSELEMNPSSFYATVEKIINKLTTNQILMRSSANRIFVVNEDTYYGKLIRLYENNPTILVHPRLNESHRRFLKALFESRDEYGVYNSISSLTFIVGASETHVKRIVKDAWVRISGES